MLNQLLSISWIKRTFFRLHRILTHGNLMLDASGVSLTIPLTVNGTLSSPSSISMFLPIAFALPKYFLAVEGVRKTELSIANGLLAPPSQLS